MQSLHEQGFALLMAVLVLPNCVPIPIPPGMSTVFSIPLLFLSAQMLMGRDAPWLPAWLADKQISATFLRRVFTKVGPKLLWLERRMRPSMPFFVTRRGERLIGFVWLLFSISIAIPLPMTNFLPGVGIFVSALALLGRDGRIILAGFAIGAVGVAVTLGLLVLGVKAMNRILFGGAPPL